MSDQTNQRPSGFFARLLRRARNGPGVEMPNRTPQETQRSMPLAGQPPTAGERLDLAEVDKQIKRLAKEVYRVNTLTEAQNEQSRQATDDLRQLLAKIEQERTETAQDAARQARLEVIKALLPVLDSVEDGILSGVLQIRALLTTDRQAGYTLAAWLNGQRLLLDRLTKLLEAEGVCKMVSVGQPFDPYKHVALKTVQDATKAPGVIVSESRHGYLVDDEILRYAEVVVNKPTGDRTA